MRLTALMLVLSFLPVLGVEAQKKPDPKPDGDADLSGKLSGPRAFKALQASFSADVLSLDDLYTGEKIVKGPRVAPCTSSVDAQGNYSLSGLEDGRYSVCLQADNWSSNPMEVRLLDAQAQARDHEKLICRAWKST